MAKKAKKKIGSSIMSDAAISKKFPGSGIASVISIPADDHIWLPSRILPVNYTLGGGIPYGRILEIFGTESSGKTLLAMDFAVVAQKLGGHVIWNDAEQSFDPHWMEINGIDLNGVTVWNETSIEKISDWSAEVVCYWRNKLKNNEPILFIQDSQAALDCEDNINSSQADSKAEMGNRAKAMYKWLRIRNQLFAELGVCSIFINQLRDKVGASNYEDPESTPAGKAMRFFASQRVGVYKGKQIKGNVQGFEDRVGNEVSFRIKKNKVAPPRPTFKTEVYFNAEYGTVGFHKYHGFGDILLRTETLTKKKGGSIYKLGDTMIARGENDLVKKMEKDPKLRRKLIKLSGINTISQTRRDIEAKTKNLYPVTSKIVKMAKETQEDSDE